MISNMCRTKQKVKVLLYNINYRADMPNKAFVPLAFVLLEEYLREYGSNMETLRYDYIIDDPKNMEFEEYCQYNMVGFSLNFANADYIVDLLRRWEEVAERPFVVVGGALPTVVALELINKISGIDVVVIAEGEESLLQLTEVIAGEKELKDVPGIVYRNDQGLGVYNPGKEPIDFDLTPIPKRDFLSSLSHEEIKSVSIRIQTARGCLGNCSFCINSYRNRLDKVTTKVWRGMSPERVVAEIEYLYNKYGVRIINFVDPSFEDPGIKGKKRIKEIASLLLKRDIRISFKVNMRAETFTDDDVDLLWLLKRAGMDIIVLGMEACTNEELKLLGKNADVDTITRAFLRLKSMDCFSIHVGYMPIHPYSTLDSVKKSYDYLHELGLSHAFNIFRCVLIPLRGTNIHDRVLDDGLLSNPDDILALPQSRFKDHRVALINDEIQELKVRNPILSRLFQINFDASNIIARSQNRIFNGMLSNHKIDEAYKRFKAGVNGLTEDFNERYYSLQKMLVRMAEKETNMAEFQDFAKKTILCAAPDILSQIENQIAQYIQIVGDEEYDVSVMQSKSWGSYCQERTKIGVK